MQTNYCLCVSCLQAVYEPEEVLVPALPETSCVERGYITPQQVYNLLNAEEGQPALYDPNYILILDCRSAERLVLLMHLYREIHLKKCYLYYTVKYILCFS